MRRTTRPQLLLLLLFLALPSLPAWAQELRVRVEATVIYAGPSADSRPLTTVMKGATLVVVREAGDWWFVRHGSTGSQGYVLKAAVEVASRGVPPAASPAPRAGAPPAARPAKSRSWTDIGWVAVNGLYQDGSTDFDDGWNWPLNAETATATARYATTGGAGFDGSAGFRVWRSLAVGVGLTVWSRNGTADITAALPHPLYLKRDRPVAGSLTAKRQETAAHLQVAWMAPVGKKLLVIVGAGPSYFVLKQGLAEGIRYGESYPFDDASFVFADSRTASKSVVGFNAGIDVGYFFTKTVGVGLTARYAGATAAVAGAGGSLSLKAGGLQAGLGLRVRIPRGAPKPAAKPAPKPPATSPGKPRR